MLADSRAPRLCHESIASHQANNGAKGKCKACTHSPCNFIRAHWAGTPPWNKFLLRCLQPRKQRLRLLLYLYDITTCVTAEEAFGARLIWLIVQELTAGGGWESRRSQAGARRRSSVPSGICKDYLVSRFCWLKEPKKTLRRDTELMKKRPKGSWRSDQ